jgi:heat shock protein HslJ
MRSLFGVTLVMAATLLLGACASEAGGTLTGQTWEAISITTQTPAFQGVVPVEGRANYTITFNEDGTFSAKADCNQVAGTYTTRDGGVLTIVPGPSTLAACGDASLGDEYVAALAQAGSYTIAGDQLTITLLDDGTISFQAAP